MKVSRFVVNPFGVNTYIMWAPESREAAIVDAGMTDDAELKAVETFIEREYFKPVHFIKTQMHIDHIFASQYTNNKNPL